jgi:hypothetical protein
VVQPQLKGLVSFEVEAAGRKHGAHLRDRESVVLAGFHPVQDPEAHQHVEHTIDAR